MRHKGLKDKLDEAAVRSEDVVRGVIDIPTGSIEKPEGAELTMVHRVRIREFALGGWVDEVSEMDLCDKLFSDLMRRLPLEPFVLLWRVVPEYKKDRDFYSGKWRHRVYLRLGWYTLDMKEKS